MAKPFPCRLNIHCMHTMASWSDDDTSHGRYVPKKKVKWNYMRCCHCGYRKVEMPSGYD